MTNWKKLLEDEMQKRNETLADLEARTLSDSQLTAQFDGTCDGPESVPLFAGTASKVSFTDGFVEVCLTVTDQEAIEKIQRGDTSEVSAVYKVEFDPTPGVTPDGESYDGIQRNMSFDPSTTTTTP